MFSDGSIRMHITDGLALSGGPTVALPGISPLLFADDFDAGKNAAWDRNGGSVASDGKLVGTGGERTSVVIGHSAQDVVVHADFKLGLPFGVIVRYVNAGNFVLANYNPAASALYFHERLNGSWGNTWGWASTAGLMGTDAHVVVTVNGSAITATISSGSGSVTATYTLNTLLGSGLFGVLTEDTLQQIDNFQTFQLPLVLGSSVDADVVQVIVPRTVVQADLVSMGDYVVVTGIAGKGLSVGGNLRAVTLRKPTDLVGDR
jgi:hypothetical protein